MRSSASRSLGRRVCLAALVLGLAVGCSEPPAEQHPTGGPAPAATPVEQPTGATPEQSDEPATDPMDLASGELDLERSEDVVTGLQTPWDVAFLADGSALVTLRDNGKVLRLRDGEPVALDAGGPDGAVPDVVHESEDGLLGLAVGPDEGIYLYLTTESDNRVVRYELLGDALVEPTVILQGIPAHRNHNGGRLAFGPDGYLYVTTGDARDLEQPQDTAALGGKILRMTTTGEPAPGNPFDNLVWSYGHRNVQGIGWTTDGRMYASEFGSSNYDELNLIEPGGNYGWPHIEGWAGDPRYIDPLVTWSTDEASPSGIAVTDAGVWMTALRGERLWYVPLAPDGTVGEAREHRLGVGRLRAVVTAPDGSLWVMTSNTDGRGDPRQGDDRIIRFAG